MGVPPTPSDFLLACSCHVHADIAPLVRSRRALEQRCISICALGLPLISRRAIGKLDLSRRALETLVISRRALGTKIPNSTRCRLKVY